MFIFVVVVLFLLKLISFILACIVKPTNFVTHNVRLFNWWLLKYLLSNNIRVNLNTTALVSWYISSGYRWNLPRNLLKTFVLSFEVFKLILSIIVCLTRSVVWGIRDTWRITISESPTIVVCFIGVVFGDYIFSDDEPFWEPVEWSFIQTWILFIFMFAWIGENIIASRYGSYSGRDKRVWLSWYKTYWFVSLGYVISLGAASLFVIIPFYHELNYTVSFTFSWWDWYTRVFFFKASLSCSVLLLVTTYLTVTVSSNSWKKNFTLVLLINLVLSYLLYFHWVIEYFIIKFIVRVTVYWRTGYWFW